MHIDDLLTFIVWELGPSLKKKEKKRKKIMDLWVFTYRSSKLTKSMKRLEDNSLILLLCNQLLEKEENV